MIATLAPLGTVCPKVLVEAGWYFLRITSKTCVVSFELLISTVSKLLVTIWIWLTKVKVFIIFLMLER